MKIIKNSQRNIISYKSKTHKTKNDKKKNKNKLEI